VIPTVIKAQKCKKIDIHKVIRAYNKANGIVVAEI